MTATTRVAGSPPQWNIVLWWLLANTLTFALAGALFHNFPLTIRFPTVGLEGEFAIGPAAVGALLGAVSGVLIGVPQWIILRRYRPLSPWWIFPTTAAVGLLHFLSDGFPDAKDLTVAVGISALLIGLLQSYLLRGILPMVVWWIFASVAWDAGWVAGVTMLDAAGILSQPWTPLVGVQQHGLLGMVMGIAYGLCTGVILAALRWQRAMALVQTFGHFAATVLVANTASGVIIGLLARLAMSLVTLAGGFSNNFAENQFTIAGTLNILMAPILFGIPFAALLVGLRRFIPGTGWRRLLMYGVVTLVFPGLLLLTDESFGISSANQTVGMAAFIPIYFLYGFLIGVVVERLSPFVPPPARPAAWQAARSK